MHKQNGSTSFDKVLNIFYNKIRRIFDDVNVEQNENKPTVSVNMLGFTRL